jgi:hypothetical protein
MNYQNTKDVWVLRSMNRFIKWLKGIKKELADTYCPAPVEKGLPTGISKVQNGKEDLQEKARRAKIVEDAVKLGSGLIS